MGYWKKLGSLGPRYINTYYKISISSSAEQGGGGNFKEWKPVGIPCVLEDLVEIQVNCCQKPLHDLAQVLLGPGEILRGT